MAFPFEGFEVEADQRPEARAYGFDLDVLLSAVVAVEATIPDDAFTAETLGTDRLGNGTVIGPNGLVLTIGYLITEAQEVMLTRHDGARIPAHPLGIDPVTGFGLLQALEPLGLPALPLGNSRALKEDASVIIAGAGGRAHAAAGLVIARIPFAGYWEYFLESAIMTEPAHPHWSGAALITSSGELAGVGSLLLERQSRHGRAPINMFVPSELLPPILDDLVHGRPAHPPRPWLGVFAQEHAGRVVIVGIAPRGPSARAELRAGDLILGVAGTQVTGLEDFYRALWAQGAPGAVIPLRVQREDDVFDVDVRSVDRAGLLKRARLN